MSRTPLIFLDTNPAFGGDTRVLIEMARLLEDSVYLPIVACIRGTRLWEELGGMQHVERLELVARGESYAAKAAALATNAQRLALTVRGRGIRMLHVNNPNSRRTLLFATLARLGNPRQIRVVYHGHCSPSGRGTENRFLARIDTLWAVSEHVRRQYAQMGLPKELLKLMPNPLPTVPGNLPERAAARAELGIPADRSMIVMVGRLSPNKGQHLAIEAFGRISESIPSHLYIVGDDALPDNNEGYLDSMKARTRELGLEDRVHFAGFDPNPWRWLRAADLACVLTEDEAFGIAALEAILSERPLVAADSTGLTEIIGNTAGVPLTPRNPADIGEAIRASIHYPPSMKEPADRLRQLYGPEPSRTRLLAELDRLHMPNPRRTNPPTRPNILAGLGA